MVPESGVLRRTTRQAVILGASGFVGAHVAGTLAADLSVLGVGRRPGPYVQIVLDLAEWDDWASIPRSADVVINAAGLVGRRPEFTEKDYLLANVYIPRMAARFAAKVGAHLLQISTTGIYGFRDGPATEETTPRPQDAYNITKYLGEIACAHTLHAEKLTILRLSFPYGSGQRRGLLPSLVGRIAAGEAVALNTEDGCPRVCPLFIADCSAAIKTVVDNEVTGVFNCGGAETVSIMELAMILGEAMGQQVRFAAGGTPCTDLLVDSSKLQDRCGWRPAVSLKEGVGRMVGTGSGPGVVA